MPRPNTPARTARPAAEAARLAALRKALRRAARQAADEKVRAWLLKMAAAEGGELTTR